MIPKSKCEQDVFIAIDRPCPVCNHAPCYVRILVGEKAQAIGLCSQPYCNWEYAIALPLVEKPRSTRMERDLMPLEAARCQHGINNLVYDKPRHSDLRFNEITKVYREYKN